MKIKELRLHPQAIADGPLRSSYGLHAPYALRTIVELKTTDGITGISETYGGDGPVAALEQARPLIEGSDPRSEEHTSELQSRGLISYAGFCLNTKRQE